ncbi:MAG: isoleucine--tRNA ligase, partial [Candidatus Woesearchaeota archaeon]|nr:isoleucine--tRNA ligase [Candidatus Woesearchaeota archaeon]
MEIPNKSYDFREIEKNVSAIWASEKIKDKVLFAKREKTFSFLEGPPTANALPALHHMEMRVFKDLFCRYKFMQGYYVPRKGGWDCHGLPVEVQVEKKLGLNSKKEVLEYGIEKFNAICRSDVFSFIEKWNEFTERLAYWVDLKNPYITMDNNYIESVWWSLKQLYSKNLLFQDYKVVPYCPRCGTTLSSHEVALGYEDVTEDTITCRFKVKESGGKARYFLAWTTTPWTLPSNLALAVNPEIEYAFVEHEFSEYILAKALSAKYFPGGKIVKVVQGKELIGMEYEPLFSYYAEKFRNCREKAFIVIAADYVSTEDGTGIVHQAPAFGEDDFVSCRACGIGFVNPVGEDGKFTSEIPGLSGVFVKDADKRIISMLESSGKLFKVEKYTHSYPFCWRCKTPLIYYARQSWFIRVSAFREKLLGKNNEINWYPRHIKEGRFGNWLEGAKDWALSRSKFWGTPLPIWKCETCGKEIAIGSVEELRKAGLKVPKNLDLHKPFIDEIEIKCQCGEPMHRVPDVIDCWYDSGSASFAQYHYPFENKELFEKHFPYDFIAEAMDQTRGWFYTLHVLGVLLFDSIAYKNVVCAGLIVDENGEKMSKSKGNVINPDEAFDKVGVDAIRLQMCYTSPGNVKRFSYNLVKENATSFLNTLWNSYYFVCEYLKNKGVDAKEFAGIFSKLETPDDEIDQKVLDMIVKNLKIEDKWIISRANSTAEEVMLQIEEHEYSSCTKAIMQFLNDDFSRWYIKIVRNRAGSKDAELSFTFLYVFDKIAKLLAPFAPYVTESIYQNLLKDVIKGENRDEKSIHMMRWAFSQKALTDKKLEEDMETAREIVTAVLFLREKKGLGVRWPLPQALVISNDKEKLESAKRISEVILKQCNIRNLGLGEETKKIRTVVKADFSKLGPEFGKKTPLIIAQLSMNSAESILSHIQEEGFCPVKVGNEEFRVKIEHLIVEKEAEQPFIMS